MTFLGQPFALPFPWASQYLSISLSRCIYSSKTNTKCCVSFQNKARTVRRWKSWGAIPCSRPAPGRVWTPCTPAPCTPSLRWSQPETARETLCVSLFHRVPHESSPDHLCAKEVPLSALSHTLLGPGQWELWLQQDHLHDGLAIQCSEGRECKHPSTIVIQTASRGV